MHSVSQRPNLRHVYEPLRGTEGLLETVLRSWQNVCDDEQVRLLEGSEFQTEVETVGADNRLVLEESRKHAENVVIKKRAEVRRMRGVESIMGQFGKFELDALVDGKPMKMLKDGKWMGAVTSNNPGECIV